MNAELEHNEKMSSMLAHREETMNAKLLQM